MKDRFPAYVSFFLIIYIALYVWELHKEREELYMIIEKQDKTILECRDLIRAQREYINILERQDSNPFYRPTYPSNRGPI